MTTAPVDFEAFPPKPERSIEELIREKRAEPLRSVEDFMEPGVFESDEEVDEFIVAVREWRNASLA
jgi:hypothetical protein